jgi:hypothetical protein
LRQSGSFFSTNPPGSRQAALHTQTQAAVLAEAMPAQWSDFIRSAPMDTVRPLGTRNLPPSAPQRYAAPQTYRSGTSTAIYFPQQFGQPPSPGGQWDV